MSLADDKSLLAMKAARMSVGSIAHTMGWSEKRVERRIAELEAAGAEACLPPRPVTPERKSPTANPVRTPKAPAPRPAPVAGAEDGLVTRTFHLTSGGFGAAVLLADARLVFTETGYPDADPARNPEPNRHITVAPADGCFRMVRPPKTEADEAPGVHSAVAA